MVKKGDEKQINPRVAGFRTGLQLLNEKNRKAKLVDVKKLLNYYCELKISPSAVEEIAIRIADKLLFLCPKFDETAKRHNRKVIRVEDIIEVLGLIREDLI